MVDHPALTRRRLLGLFGAAAAVPVLSACGSSVGGSDGGATGGSTAGGGAGPVTSGLRQNTHLRRVDDVDGTLVNAVVADLGPQSQPA